MSRLERRIPYLAPLDGLRGLSVIAVLLYHGGAGWVRGGYLGVEVFFVLSGYLITSLLLAEHASTGRVRLRAFWGRRARRLLPELFAVIVASLVVAVAFLPDEVPRLRADAPAALGFVMNWRLIFSHQSYFEAFGRPSLLRHLWSLAVEEQFYVFWPPIVVLVAGARHRYRIAVLAVAGCLGSALLASLLFDSAADPSRLYYGTDTRISGILAGAALAALWPQRGVQTTTSFRGAVIAAIGWVALAQLFVLFVLLRESNAFLYRGGFAAVDLTTVALIVATRERPLWLPARLLGSRVMRWVGTRSYGIYLWHWPVFMLTRANVDIALDGAALMALRLAVTLALAEASYRCLAAPIRSGRLLRRLRALNAAGHARAWALRGSAVSGVAAMGVLVALVVVAGPARPPAYLAVASFHGVLTPPDAATGTDPVSGVASRLPAVHSSDDDTLAAADATDTPPPEDSTEGGNASPASPHDAGNSGQAPPPASSLPAAHFAADIYAVGDSVMLGARYEMARAGWVEMDAAVGRQPASLAAILRDRSAAGSMPPVVVIHLGNNGPFSRRNFDQAMDALDGVRQVVVVTVKVDRPWEDDTNATVWAASAAYSNVTVVDWHGASEDHPEYFYSDHTHLTAEGANAYARLISAAIRPIAAPTATPTPEPTATPGASPTTTPSASATKPATVTPTVPASATVTPSATNSPGAGTPSATASPSVTGTAATPSASAVPSATATPTASASSP